MESTWARFLPARIAKPILKLDGNSRNDLTERRAQILGEQEPWTAKLGLTRVSHCHVRLHLASCILPKLPLSSSHRLRLGLVDVSWMPSLRFDEPKMTLTSQCLQVLAPLSLITGSSADPCWFTASLSTVCFRSVNQPASAGSILVARRRGWEQRVR
jgi:hypothetical protein